jgi:hypothetical protein
MAQLAGKAEVAINNISIPASYLSEIVVSFVEGTRERNTLGGKFTRPSGSLDMAQAKFTMFLPSMDYLKNIFPGVYNLPTAPQTTGNIIFNANSCSTTPAGPVNIHFTCEDNDNNDVFIYSGLALLDFSATYNPTDDIAIPVTIFAQADTNGNVA